MKLEEQVVSLELAKRLKELGVKQESIFAWLQYPHTRAGEPNEWELTYTQQPKDNPLWVSAFTVAELGEMLPRMLHSTANDKARWLGISNGSPTMEVWYVHYESIGDQPDYKFTQEAKTEADARAKMMVYLIENNLITI